MSIFEDATGVLDIDIQPDLLEPLLGVLGEVVLLRVGEQVLDQGGEHCLEVGTVGGGCHFAERCN